MAFLTDPVPLSQHRWPVDVEPLVSIICNTYNQAPFVKDALDGFLRQRTTFPVEILVHDDASSDRTAAIISEYYAEYPNLFRPTLQKDNQYSKGHWVIRFSLNRARGKYVALCEGDDYWTASTKLQAQIDALEARRDACGCIHRADARFEETGEVIPGHYGPPVVKTEYSLGELLSGENFVPTASIVLRSHFVKDLPAWLELVPHADLSILSVALMGGPLLYIDRSFSVYRKHKGGIHSRDSYMVQVAKCVQTLSVIGANLPGDQRDAVKAGLSFRMRQITDEIEAYQQRIAALAEQHESDRAAITSIMQSATFKVGAFTKRILRPFSRPVSLIRGRANRSRKPEHRT